MKQPKHYMNLTKAQVVITNDNVVYDSWSIKGEINDDDKGE